MQEVDTMYRITQLKKIGKPLAKDVYELDIILGKVVVKLYDVQGSYLNKIAFRITKHGTLSLPITFEVTTIDEFYTNYIDRTRKDRIIVALSPKDMRKIKKVYNKDNIVLWKDDEGFIYYASKHLLPSKKDRELFEEFKNSPKAVLVKHTTEKPYETVYKWYHSEKDFITKFKEIKRPPAYSTPYYFIKDRKFNTTPPDDRRVIKRLPYFDIETEYKICQSIPTLSRAWSHRMIDYTEYEIIESYELYEKITKILVLALSRQ